MSQRPPADDFINEAFNDRKCGQPDKANRLEFLDWCMKAGPYIKTKCRGIQGSEGLCEFEAEFHERIGKRAYTLTDRDVFIVPDDENFVVANISFLKMDRNSPNLPPPPPIKAGEWDFSYNHSCHFGGNKWTNWTDMVQLKRSKFESLYHLCRQEVYGAPYVMPWWLIVLIVLIVLSAVGVAMSLFWKFWLRSKIIAMRDPAFASGYTSAPFSSSSAIQSSSSRARSQVRPGSSARLSSTSRLPISGASSGVPVSKVSGINGSSVLTGGSAVPTSGASRSSQRATSSGSRVPSYLMSREPSVRSTRLTSVRR